MTLTTNQLTDLVNEFVSIQINDMSQEDIYAYISSVVISLILNSMNSFLRSVSSLVVSVINRHPPLLR